MVDYPRFEEHVGTRAASPTGELGSRAASASSPLPAAVELLMLLADAYAGDREPSEDQLAALGEDLDRGVVSARLRAIAAALGQLAPSDVEGLRLRARNCWASYDHYRDVMNTDGMRDAREAAEFFDALAAKLETLLSGT